MQRAALRLWMLATAPCERGASLVEYALLLALIAVMCLGAVNLVGGTTNTALSRAGSALP